MCHHFQYSNVPPLDLLLFHLTLKKLDKIALKDPILEITNGFKLLGIKFTPSLENVNLNYQQYLSNIRSKMYAWTRIGLSKTKKVYVGKTYILSKFNHVAAIL